MPVNNALTPEGQNSLGAAFGYFPQLRRNRTAQDPRLAADVPLQFLRGRTAATLGAPSDILNFLRSPLPMEVVGDVDYAQQAQVPYGSQELLRTLPLPPQGAAQEAAANVGAVVPLTPMEALAAARAARQAAFATGRTLGPAAAGMAENLLQRQGLMPGVLPSPKSLTMPSVPTVEQMKQHGRAEVVPLSQAVSFQTARNWDKFKAGKGPGDLVQGFGDKPLALRLETGEYVIYDGNHRTDLALQQGKTALPMHVIDVKSYDPAHAGRKPVPSKISDDELLSLLGADTSKFQYPQEEALRLAQQRAALPVEQYGLGLPAGNTAEQRSAAMGFNTDLYHGTTDPTIKRFDPSLAGKKSSNPFDENVFATTSPQNAGGYALNWNSYKKNVETSPAFQALSNQESSIARQFADLPAGPSPAKQDLSAQLESVRLQKNQIYNDFMEGKHVSEDATIYPLKARSQDFFPYDAAGKNWIRANRPAIDAAQQAGFEGTAIQNVKDNAGRWTDVVADSYATTNPDLFRSRFAAFDPFRRNAAIAAATGAIAPDLLAAQAEQDAYSKNELRKFKRQSAR